MWESDENPFARTVMILAFALPLSIFVLSLLVNDGPDTFEDAMSRALILGGIGALLFAGTIGYVAAISMRESESLIPSSLGFEGRFKIWGFGALALFVAIWLGMAALLIRQESKANQTLETTAAPLPFSSFATSAYSPLNHVLAHPRLT